MLDDLGPLTFLERVARLEERSAAILPMLDAIRAEQKVIAAAIARASGGLRVLVVLGGLIGAASAMRRLVGWATTLFGVDAGPA